MPISRFYFNHHDPEAVNFYIKGLGIHEHMRPGIIRHEHRTFPYLLMFFHDQAWLNPEAGNEKALNGFVIWEPGQAYSYGNALNNWNHSWLLVHGESIAPALARNHFPVNQLLFFKMEKIFIDYLKMIYAEMKKQPEHDAFMLEGIVQLMLYELSRAYRHGEELIPDHILAAEEFIQKNFHHNIALEDIASVAGLSVPRFIVIFKQYYGETPVQYLIRSRLERAAQLLQYKYLSIKQISKETGFSDQLYFSRKFRERFSASPRDFRKKL